MPRWTWVSRKERRRRVALENLLKREGSITEEVRELRKAQSIVRNALRKARKEKGKDAAEQMAIDARIYKLEQRLQMIAEALASKRQAYQEIAVLKQRVAA